MGYISMSSEDHKDCPPKLSCSVEMVSFRRLDFLSVCQSVCTPLLGLAEHCFDHVHGVVGLRLFNEAA